MKKVNNQELLEGDIQKGLMQLAFPLMFLNLINSLYNIVDTFWIGKMGELQIGAVTLIGPIMGCGSAFITGLSAAGISLIAMAIGARDIEKANKSATHLFLVSLVLGILMGLICLIFAHPILHWLNTPQERQTASRWSTLRKPQPFREHFLLISAMLKRQKRSFH